MINPMTGQPEPDQTMGLGIGPGMNPLPAPSPVSPGQDPLALAEQTLAEAQQVLAAPPTAPPDPAAAPLPPAAPTAQPLAAPAGPLAQQQGAIRAQQFEGINRARGIEAEEIGLAQQGADLKVGNAQAQADADQAKLEAFDKKQVEEQQIKAKYDELGVQAKAKSDQAAHAWANAKPRDWFEDQSTGTKIAIVLGMALGYGADAKTRGTTRGGVGDQALAALTGLIDKHKAEEMAQLERQFKIGTAAPEQVKAQRTAALQDHANRWAGIEKGLELQARSTLSAKGVDVAKQESNTAVVQLKKRAEAADQQRLTTVGDDVARAMQIEVSARKRAGGGGGGPTDPNDPYAGLNANQRLLAQKRDRDEEEKDAQRVVPGWDGKPKGLAPQASEAKAARERVGTAKGIVSQLDSMKAKVGSMGFWDRTLGSWGEKGQQIAGDLDVMIGPMTQVLGAGTPQDAERIAKIRALSANIKQNPETAVKNIETLQNYLKSSVESINDAMGLAPMDNAYRAPTAAKGQQRPGETPVAAAKPEAKAGGLPEGAEPWTHQGVQGYRRPTGKTNPKTGKKLYEFTPWPE